VIELDFGEVEGLLARLNRISDSKRVAFRARLKHFQRMGLPHGANTGTGKKARYSFPMALQLCVAFQLAQTGMAPKRIVSTVEGNWIAIRFNCFAAMLSPDQAKAFKPPLTNRVAMVVNPEALRELTISGEGEYDYYETVDFFVVADLASKLAADSPGPIPTVGEVYRHIVIQLWPLMQTVAWHLSELRNDLTHEALLSDLQEHLLEEGRRITEMGEQIRKTMHGRDP
jgi:hypothetical protein